jgi:tight adherence protein C
MAAVLAGLAGLTVTLFILGLARPNSRSSVRERLERMGRLQPEARSQSFSGRILVPIASRLGEGISAFLPNGIRRRLAAHLETAGMHVTAERFLTWWTAIGVVLPSAMFLLRIVAGNGISGRAVLGLLCWISATMLLPWYWVRGRARRRTKEIDRGLSDAMDLIVTNVESGVGLQAALINVSQKYSGPIGFEFTRTIREIALGRSSQEALDAMGRRSGSREMALLARAVAQAERNGIPIARVLRAQADELRERRRQNARERANTFPLRITLLTVMFIFPSLFMLILGPVVLDVMDLFKT